MTRGAVFSGKASAVRLSRLLVASFVLTISSFVAATVVSEYRARDIETVARNMTTTSTSCLATAREHLRQTERLLERLTAELGTKEDYARIARYRDAFNRQWAACAAHDTDPVAQQLREAMAKRAAELNTSVDAVLKEVKEGDRSGAEHELVTRAEPAMDRIDDVIMENLDATAQRSAVAGARIVTVESTSETTRAVLTTLSAVFAATAAAIMLRVLRRFTSLMEARVSELESFAGRVAHDIRSPLASVGIALELTRQHPEEAVERGAVDRAIRTMQRVGQLVDDLLVFARAGATPSPNACSDLADVLGGVVDEMRPSADAHGITLEVEPPPRVTVACGSGVLISVLSNLIGNAIKHMGDSPVRRVSVRARERARTVRVEVVDTGPGVPPAQRGRIFDPYVRAAKASSPGLGLGLATVRRLVEAHGGVVGVLSNGERGSIFWFELPKVDATAAPAVVPATIEACGAGASRCSSS